MLSELKEFFKADTFANLLGIEIIDAKDGFCTCKMQKRDDLLNATGVIQGGALYTLGDFCFAVASASTGKKAVTSMLTMTYLRPAVGNEIIAKATPVHLGKRIYNYEVSLFDGDKIVARLAVQGCVIDEK